MEHSKCLVTICQCFGIICNLHDCANIRFWVRSFFKSSYLSKLVILIHADILMNYIVDIRKCPKNITFWQTNKGNFSCCYNPVPFLNNINYIKYAPNKRRNRQSQCDKSEFSYNPSLIQYVTDQKMIFIGFKLIIN